MRSLGRTKKSASMHTQADLSCTTSLISHVGGDRRHQRKIVSSLRFATGIANPKVILSGTMNTEKKHTAAAG